MKNYSQAQAGKGKTAYRTPSVFRFKKCLKVIKNRDKNKKIISPLFKGRLGGI